MRTTGRGRSRSGRVGVVRSLLAALCVSVVALAGGVASYRSRRPEPDSLPSLLPRIDSLLSDPVLDADASALIDEADALSRKLVVGVESSLSLLKRRRVLASRKGGEYADRYLESALAATDRLPHADAILAAVVDAALRLPPKDSSSRAALAAFAPRLDPKAFGALRWAAERRLGTASAPTALVPPAALLAAAAAYERTDPAAAAAFTADAVIAALLGGDVLGARTIVRDFMPKHDGLSPAILRFLAELEYDFGDTANAAALFSRLPGPEAAARRADAAYLAGQGGAARSAWLASLDGPAAAASLYNLAASAASPAEALSYARRLVAAAPDFEPGAVLYSRLSGDSSHLRSRAGLAELELIRLESPLLGAARTRARLWLLLNARPNLEAAAEWAAWRLASDGDFAEAALVAEHFRKSTGGVALSAAWAAQFLALEAALSGRLEEAEKAFERAASAGGDWRVAANSALPAEARRNGREALRRYEIAASLGPDSPDAAEIQLRIARLLKSMGKPQEARRALEYALDLDPDNRTAKTDLKKLLQSPNR